MLIFGRKKKPKVSKKDKEANFVVVDENEEQDEVNNRIGIKNPVKGSKEEKLIQKASKEDDSEMKSKVDKIKLLEKEIELLKEKENIEDKIDDTEDEIDKTDETEDDVNETEDTSDTEDLQQDSIPETTEPELDLKQGIINHEQRIQALESTI